MSEANESWNRALESAAALAENWGGYAPSPQGRRAKLAAAIRAMKIELGHDLKPFALCPKCKFYYSPIAPCRCQNQPYCICTYKDGVDGNPQCRACNPEKPDGWIANDYR